MSKSRYRDRAVVGLLHAAVVAAVAYVSIGKTGHAEHAPVFIPASILVVDPSVGHDLKISMEHFFEFVRAEQDLWLSSAEVISSTLGLNVPPAFLGNLSDLSDFRYGILAYRQMKLSSNVKSGGLSKVLVVNIPPELTCCFISPHLPEGRCDPHGGTLV